MNMLLWTHTAHQELMQDEQEKQLMKWSSLSDSSTVLGTSAGQVECAMAAQSYIIISQIICRRNVNVECNAHSLQWHFFCKY